MNTTKPLKIGAAARFLKISIRTLHRAEAAGRIVFRAGRIRTIGLRELYHAQVLTLGQLARRVRVPYSSLLRAAKKGELPAQRPLVGRGGAATYRHASLAAVLSWIERRRRKSDTTRSASKSAQ